MTIFGHVNVASIHLTIQLRINKRNKLVVVGHCIYMAGTSLNLVLVGLVFEGPVSRLKNIATGLDQDQKRLDILHAVMSSLIYQSLILCGART